MGIFGKDALNYIIILQLTMILSLPIVPYTIEEAYNETVPVKEYQQYVELVPIVKERCKNDPVKFFQDFGWGTSNSAIGGAAAGSFIPGLGTATGGLIGSISGIYFSIKKNIQSAIESGDIKN